MRLLRIVNVRKKCFFFIFGNLFDGLSTLKNQNFQKNTFFIRFAIKF